MSEPTPIGSMIRKWNPGSDTSGPPDEIVTTGNIVPTEADRADGVRADIAPQEIPDATDD